MSLEELAAYEATIREEPAPLDRVALEALCSQLLAAHKDDDMMHPGCGVRAQNTCDRLGADARPIRRVGRMLSALLSGVAP